MKNIFKVSFLCMFMATCFACDKLEDVNINPNDPEEGSVNVDRLLASVQIENSKMHMILELDLTSRLVQQSEWNNKTWEEEMIGKRGDEMWNAYFKANGGIRNLNYIFEYAEENDGYYKAMALITKSYINYTLTSCFGDIPYSEAGKAKEGLVQPKYDKQEDVFKGILVDLEEANTLIKAGSTIPIQGDFILGGRPEKWRKFANSLRVRVLIAQSKQVDPSVELKKIVSDPTNYPLMESNDDQAAFSYSKDAKCPRTRLNDHQVGYMFATNTVVDKLIQYGDDRLYMHAHKIVDADVPYRGVAPGAGGSLGTHSKLPPFLLISDENFALEQVWMHYAEVEFMLAEAAERGWIDGGSAKAKEHYEEGIEASYEYQRARQIVGKAGKLTIAGIFDYSGDAIDYMREWAVVNKDDAYFEQDGVKYNKTPANNLQQIAEQKWIALQWGMESWFSYRRTGLPALTSYGNKPLPLRFTYPANEQFHNEANLDAAIASQGADEWTTKMWILK